MNEVFTERQKHLILRGLEARLLLLDEYEGNFADLFAGKLKKEFANSKKETRELIEEIKRIFKIN